MSNPIAKVSLYRLDGELRGTVLRTYEGAGLLPLGDHDVYAAPVTAANQPEPVNQQTLAALNGLTEDIQCLIGESAGVYGLHLNGDLSPWGELEAGGRFERLTHLPDAHAAIAAAEEAQPVWQQAEHNLTDVRCECCGYLTHQREHMGCIRAANPPAVAVPDGYISQAREAAIDVFSGSCSATKDAIEYFAAELRAKLSAAQKPEGHQ